MTAPTRPPETRSASSRRTRRTQDAEPGWWRRNRWGLLALPFAAALAVGPPLHDLLDARQERPSVVGTVSAGAWGVSGGVRYRLTGLTPFDQLDDKYDMPFAMPAGARIWRADLDVEIPAGVKAEGCALVLVDDRGREYAADPGGTSALEKADCPLDLDESAPSTSDSGGARTAKVSSVFLAPKDIRPAEVRVAGTKQVPHYVALRVP